MSIHLSPKHNRGRTMKFEVTVKMQELRELYGGICQKCGSSKNLQFAHIKPTSLLGYGRGMKNRYYDIKNNKSCYALLCYQCHRRFDKLNDMWKNKNPSKTYKHSFEEFLNDF